MVQLKQIQNQLTVMRLGMQNQLTVMRLGMPWTAWYK